MIELVAGENCPLTDGLVSLCVSGPFDLSALVTGSDGRVAGDGDFVFYNQPEAPGLRLTHGSVTVDVARLRRGAARVVVVASPEDMATPFGRLPAPTMTVVGRGNRLVASFRPTGLAAETVVQLGEVYRRGDGWKFRAIGQGYANGLAGLARDFGVEVDDDGAARAYPPAAARPVPAGDRQVQMGARQLPASGYQPPSPERLLGVPALVGEVVAQTNAQRARYGLTPLTVDHRLTRAAQGHSDDMVARKFFAHDCPDGSSVADRVVAVGYTYAVVAENIASGQRTAAEVVDGWMDSPGHRANILNPDVRQIGVGFTVGGELGTMWTQVFGAPL